MDALGCYSSSDDSSVKEEIEEAQITIHPAEEVKSKSTNNNAQEDSTGYSYQCTPGGVMDGYKDNVVFFGHVPSHHLEDDEDEQKNNKGLILSKRCNDGTDTGKGHDQVNDKKRQKLRDSIEMNLPPPQLSNGFIQKTKTIKNNSFHELIRMEKDYLRLLPPSKVLLTRNQKSEGTNNKLGSASSLETKLNALYNEFYNNESGCETKASSFASHLKSQKEFGNPHMFPSVTDYFGINHIGSNLPTAFFDPKRDFKKFEYIERLAAKEEEVRILQAQQQNQL